jgi:hypothetical protein
MVSMISTRLSNGRHLCWPVQIGLLQGHQPLSVLEATAPSVVVPTCNSDDRLQLAQHLLMYIHEPDQCLCHWVSLRHQFRPLRDPHSSTCGLNTHTHTHTSSPPVGLHPHFMFIPAMVPTPHRFLTRSPPLVAPTE